MSGMIMTFLGWGIRPDHHPQLAKRIPITNGVSTIYAGFALGYIPVYLAWHVVIEMWVLVGTAALLISVPIINRMGKVTAGRIVFVLGLNVVLLVSNLITGIENNSMSFYL